MFPEDWSEFFKGLTFTINGQPFLDAIGRIKYLEEKKVTTFKVGDKVRLKEKFYDEDDFKNDERYIREAIAKIKGQSWKIETFTSFESQQRACSSEKHCFYSIPVSLLELVERLPEKTDAKFKVGDIVRGIGKYYGITNGKMTKGKVVRVYGETAIDVVVLEHEEYVGDTEFFVQSKYFELVKKPVVEVKRKAKVGEYIKIVTRSMATESHYVVGDECKCLQVDDDGDIYATTRGTHPCNIGKNTSYIAKREYVVLENYVPKEKVVETVEKKIEPKIGMWAEVIQEHCGKPVGSIVQIVEVSEAGKVFYKCTTEEHPRGTFTTYTDRLKLLPNYKPLRKWSDTEIMEAKSIIAEGLFEISKTGYFHLVPIDDGGQVTLDFCGKIYFSNCCESDEWNIWIGRMVVMCKATGRKLPSWIRKDGTK